MMQSWGAIGMEVSCMAIAHQANGIAFRMGSISWSADLEAGHPVLPTVKHWLVPKCSC